jgi:hypothetical protein
MRPNDFQNALQSYLLLEKILLLVCHTYWQQVVEIYLTMKLLVDIGRCTLTLHIVVRLVSEHIELAVRDMKVPGNLLEAANSQSSNCK